MRAIPGIIGPVFMAMVLTITVNPIRGWLLRHGANRAVASLGVFLTVLAIVVGLFVATVVGVVQLATLLPQYSTQIQQELSGLESWLAGLGVTSADIKSLFSSISSGRDRRVRRGAAVQRVGHHLLRAVDGRGADLPRGRRRDLRRTHGEGATRPGTGAERVGGVRQGHPQVLRCRHRVRRDRRGPGRGGVADSGDPGGRVVGVGGFRDQLHPEYRFHHRPDPAGDPRVAGRRAGSWRSRSSSSIAC